MLDVPTTGDAEMYNKQTLCNREKIRWTRYVNCIETAVITSHEEVMFVLGSSVDCFVSRITQQVQQLIICPIATAYSYGTDN